MGYSSDFVLNAGIVSLILVLTTLTTIIAYSTNSSEPLSAYDVFSSWQGTVVALSHKVVYINNDKAVIINFDDANLRIFSAVVGNGGSILIIAGSYNSHPLLGMINLSSKEAKLNAYVGYSINGSFFKVRLTGNYLYCAGYVIREQLYNGIILAVDTRKLIHSELVLQSNALIVPCENSCYIRDITIFSNNEIIALGAYYNLEFYPKYQLMLILLDNQLRLQNSFIIEAENSLIPKGLYVVENSTILCTSATENAVCFFKLNIEEIGSTGKVRINLLKLKNSLLSVTGIGSNKQIYVLIRTSGFQYVLRIHSASSSVELTELATFDPVAIMLIDDEPILMTSDYKLTSIQGITRIVPPTDVGYSELHLTQIMARMSNVKFNLTKLKVKVTELVGIKESEHVQNRKVSQFTEVSTTHLSERNTLTKEEFRRDIVGGIESSYIILGLSIILISLYLILRSKAVKI